MEDDPRTPTDIIRDMLDELREHEWLETAGTCGRGCACLRWEYRCPSCGADRDDKKGHKDYCRLRSLIVESEAYLARIEEEANRPDPPRPTAWEHIANGC